MLIVLPIQTNSIRDLVNMAGRNTACENERRARVALLESDSPLGSRILNRRLQQNVNLYNRTMTMRIQPANSRCFVTIINKLIDERGEADSSILAAEDTNLYEAIHFPLLLNTTASQLPLAMIAWRDLPSGSDILGRLQKLPPPTKSLSPTPQTTRPTSTSITRLAASSILL